ncbi:MAG: MFS transporter [Dehalococcoidales bacterium]|nr:MFS transporter [Dehalococcoidales bacterium]
MTGPVVVEQKRKKIWGMHSNVFFMGITSLLTDIGSELIFTFVPLVLINILNASSTMVGVVGGISESADSFLRIFSGWLSDKVGNRKLPAVLGYSISAIVKPLMLIANSWGAVAGIRFGDRVGKGVRTASRDALIADSAGSGERGRAFGLHRAMDTSGAVIGLIIAAIIVYLIPGDGLHLDAQAYRWMVVAGVIPSALAVLVLAVFVHEKRKQAVVRDTSGSVQKTTPFTLQFKLFLVVMALFTLGNSSDFFLILRAQNVDVPLLQVVLMLVLFNLTYSVIAMPMGILSDKLGRKRVIALGWLVYGLAYLGLALATDIWQIWLLFALYGIYYGVCEGVAKAFVADLVPVERRGTAYGLYNGIVGIMVLPASLIAGILWDKAGPSSTFYFGAGLALLAMVGMTLFIKERRA